MQFSLPPSLSLLYYDGPIFSPGLGLDLSVPPHLSSSSFLRGYKAVAYAQMRMDRSKCVATILCISSISIIYSIMLVCMWVCIHFRKKTNAHNIASIGSETL